MRKQPFVPMIVLALIRTFVGVFFVFVGLVKLARYGTAVAAFAHWGIPAPNTAVIVFAALEIVCGGMFALGALTRPAGLLLATLAIIALATAGRVDGGIYLVVPLILFGACTFFAWRSGRIGGPIPARRPGVQ